MTTDKTPLCDELFSPRAEGNGLVIEDPTEVTLDPRGDETAAIVKDDEDTHTKLRTDVWYLVGLVERITFGKAIWLDGYSLRKGFADFQSREMSPWKTKRDARRQSEAAGARAIFL